MNTIPPCQTRRQFLYSKRVRTLALLAGLGLTLCLLPGRGSTAPTAQLRYHITDVGSLGMYGGGVAGLNDWAEIVGYISSPVGTRAFLWRRGKMHLLSFGHGDSFIWGINNRGEVLGTLDPGNNARSFVWRDGKKIPLHPDLRLILCGLNDRGEIVGRRGKEALLWQNGVGKALGTLPHGLSAGAQAVNNRGQVVGYAGVKTVGRNTLHGTVPDPLLRAFIWDARNGMRDLGSLPYHGETSTDTYAVAINDRGQVVGASFGHPFLWQNGQFQRLPEAPGYEGANPGPISNKGQIIGNVSTNSGGQSTPLLWNDGKVVDLNTAIPQDSGWKLLSVSGINDMGQIAGVGVIHGEIHVFLLTPGA